MTPERLNEVRSDVRLWHQMGMNGIQCNTVEELLAHTDAQAKQIEQLQADKERLDWLESRGCSQIACNGFDDSYTVADDDSEEWADWFGKGDTLREAIDNAKGGA